MNWRRSEFISLSTVLAVAGWIWYASSKTTRWDEVASKVEDRDKGLDSHEVRIRLLEQETSKEMAILNRIADAVGAKKSGG